MEDQQRRGSNRPVNDDQWLGPNVYTGTVHITPEQLAEAQRNGGWIPSGAEVTHGGYLWWPTPKTPARRAWERIKRMVRR